MDEYKLLIVSNNCLSQHNSNGRTLLNMLSGFKRENLFQIYTSGEYTDDTYCSDSYRLTNRDVLNSYLGIRADDKKTLGKEDSSVKQSGNLSSKKNAVTMLLRDLAWDCSRKLKKNVIEWAQKKQPDAIILQLGDSTHLIQIALELIEILNIPLVTYNTEEYYFKDYDYMKKSHEAGITYKIFHKRFCHKFNVMMELNPICVYNCEELRKLYEFQFGNPGHVVYGATDFETTDIIKSKKKIVYAGNLGVGRHKCLIEIGKALQRIDSDFNIDIYGSGTQDIEECLKQAEGINFHGFVSYAKVCEEIRHSTLLVHVESFDSFSKMDTKYAFSTKLADYLKSGIPMFLYAPEDGAGASYLKENAAAFLADKASELESSLAEALFDNKKRQQVIYSALALANRNHDAKKNSAYFADIINEAIKGRDRYGNKAQKRYS